MKECKTCMQLGIDIMFYVSRGNLDKSIETVEKLLSVLKTYKESC
jgi:hypothetical protein